MDYTKDQLRPAWTVREVQKLKLEKQYIPNDEFKGRLNIYINLA